MGNNPRPPGDEHRRDDPDGSSSGRRPCGRSMRWSRPALPAGEPAAPRGTGGREPHLRRYAKPQRFFLSGHQDETVSIAVFSSRVKILTAAAGSDSPTAQRRLEHALGFPAVFFTGELLEDPVPLGVVLAFAAFTATAPLVRLQGGEWGLEGRLGPSRIDV